MPVDEIECESFTVISIDSVLLHENNYYLKLYLENSAYKIVNKQIIKILIKLFFEN